MGLTKPRAAQIFNLDYKQSTRVVTATNITLSGGAPNSVDGINLSLNDRVLVTGQTAGSQNGLYLVTTLGSGSNGTWARTSDGNENGEIEAGMIVMVTEGIIYADTQWKLITDDPIVIGTTALTFTQNYMANSISSGTSNVVVGSNANVTISSAGTANVLTVSSTGTVTSGTGSVTGNITGGNILTGGQVSATGNITANYFLGNVACASGIFSSRIFNGTSEANIGASGGNANISIGGTSNVAVFATTGQFVTGLISATGNITGGNVLSGANINATTYTGTTVSATANITGGNVLTGGIASATGNITGGNIRTAGTVSATGCVYGIELYSTQSSGDEGGQLNLALAATNTTLSTSVAIDIFQNRVRIFETGGTNRGGYFDLSTCNAGVGTNFAAGGGGGGTPGGANTQVQYNNLGAFGASAAFTFNNVSNAVVVTGNITGGNLLTAGLISATGNITGGNILGGANVNATTHTGTSVSVSGGVTAASVAGGVITGTSTSVSGGVTAASVSGGVITGSSVSVSGTVTGASLAGTITTASQTNITAVGTLGSLSVTANTTVGNLLTGGLISATGNISGGNFNITGNIVDTGALAIITSSNGNITLSPNGTGVIVVNTDIRNGQANATGNIGSATNYFNTVFAKATSAQYADLAEMYASDQPYSPGTVVEFGGSAEITQSTQSHNTRVTGIVSTNPSYLMNATLTGDHVLPVALVGRVPCQVVGTIVKGDRLVASDKPGVATALDGAKYQPACIIGKALENYDSTEVGTIEVAVGRT